MVMYEHPKIYERALKFIHGKNLQKRYSKMLRLIGNRKVFEIGCGTAMFGESFTDKKKYSGIDMNEKFLEHARKKGLDVKKMNIWNFRNYPKAECYVVCDVLHHIVPNHEKFLNELISRKKMIIVCEPFDGQGGAIEHLIGSFLDWDHINPLMRERWYNKVELKEFFKRMRFDKFFTIGKDLIAVKYTS